MPYFREIQALMAEVLLWADQRHEQGINIQAPLTRLKDEIRRTLIELEHAQPSPEAEQREPNALESIKLLRPHGPRRLWNSLENKDLHSKLMGAWLGRAAGCTLGAPVEDWTPEAMEDLALLGGQAFPPCEYWAVHPRTRRACYVPDAMSAYLKGTMCGIPVDDDTTYTLLGLLILEKYGAAFTTADAGRMWIDLLPLAFTAEDVALRNLKVGVDALEAGERHNPYQEWIGADIRSDPWGYAAPGWPERAAEMAYRDAYLSHRQNGLYGSMFFAAAIAAAFAVDDPLEAIAIGLTEIPAGCRLAEDVRWALQAASIVTDWREARRQVLERFAGMDSTHTNNNACLTILGLALGQKDFTQTIGYTVAMGLDNDCTAATAGSILGAIIGKENIPESWWKPFGDTVSSYLIGHNSFSTSDLVGRFEQIARRVVDSHPA